MNEILALLTAKTVNLEGSGGGEITPQMVAAALRGMDEDVLLYAQVKFADDANSVGRLARIMYNRALNTALREGWRITKKESTDNVRRLAVFALNESIHPKHCLRCKGSGNINNEGECDRCGGTGNPQPRGQKMIASVLGVSESRAGQFWQDKLRGEMGVYIDFEQIISDELRKELKT